MIRFAFLIVALIASPAIATECFQPSVAAKIVTQSAVTYQYAAEPARVLFLIGAPYRAAVIASKHDEDREAIEEAKLLRRFREFLQSEQETGRSTAKSSVMVEKCAKCHSEKNAAGGIVLDGSKSLSAEEKASVMRSILSGEMPKDLKPLDDKERVELANFLFLMEW